MNDVIKLGIYPAEAVAEITWGTRVFHISATNLRHLAGLARMDIRNASDTVRQNMEPVIESLAKLANEMIAASTVRQTPAEQAECLARYHATGSGADVSGMKEYLSGGVIR